MPPPLINLIAHETTNAHEIDNVTDKLKLPLIPGVDHTQSLREPAGMVAPIDNMDAPPVLNLAEVSASSHLVTITAPATSSTAANPSVQIGDSVVQHNR